MLSIHMCRYLTKSEVNHSLFVRPLLRDYPNNSESLRWRQLHPGPPADTSEDAQKSEKCEKYPKKCNEVTVAYRSELAEITVPLPTEGQRCRFTLRPVSQTVGDLLEQVKLEDKGVNRVVLLTPNKDARIASSDTIESLLTNDFLFVINDNEYYVKSLPQDSLNTDRTMRLNFVKNLVNQLYEALHVHEHRIHKEREIRIQLEKLKADIQPLEQKRLDIETRTSHRISLLTWAWLGLMSVEVGCIVRLTWWEYSWDVMEPITYLATYVTGMAAYAYFVLTKQKYNLPNVKDRRYLLMFYDKAKKFDLNISEYNRLKDEIYKLEKDLARLHDPLNLPHAKTSSSVINS